MKQPQLHRLLLAGLFCFASAVAFATDEHASQYDTGRAHKGKVDPNEVSEIFLKVSIFLHPDSIINFEIFPFLQVVQNLT